jgi:hypothetical protein
MRSEIEIYVGDTPARLITVICVAFILAFTILGYAVNIAGYHWSAFCGVKEPLRFLYVVFTALLLPLGLLLLARNLRALGFLALLVSAVGIFHVSSIDVLGHYMEPEKAAPPEYLAARIRIFGVTNQK